MLSFLRGGPRGLGRREVDALAETLRRRGVRRIAHLHCQQFAPWRALPVAPSDEVRIAEADADAVRRFAEAAQSQGGAISLFYQPHLVVGPVRAGAEVRIAAPGDLIGFLAGAPAAADLRARAMAEVAAAGFDIQVQVDHRRFTWAPLLADDALADRIARPESRARDGARFELALRLSLDAIRRETGLPLAFWLFAHRDGALNGCDRGRCTLADELAILSRNGCVGDFSLPGGDEGCAPPFDEPVLIAPVMAVRAWETPEAEPERAWGNGWAAAEKLFLWSAAAGTAIALDRPGATNSPGAAAQRAVENGAVLDGMLWLTTHARFAPGAEANFALDLPPARRLLDGIADAAGRAGAELVPITALDAYRTFVADREHPASGLALTIPAAVNGRREAGRLARRDMINLLAIDEVLSGIKSMGLKESGATEFYQGRAEKGQMLAPYEPLLAEMLLDRRPALEQVWEPGCGAALFTMLMAANGVPATGFDRQDHRLGLAARIRDRVTGAGGALPAACEIRKGRAPQMLRRVDGRNAALVFTNVIGSITDADEEALIRLAAGFRIFVVDLSRFLSQRDAAAQAVLLERLAAAGLPTPLRLAGFPGFRIYLREGESW